MNDSATMNEPDTQQQDPNAQQREPAKQQEPNAQPDPGGGNQGPDLSAMRDLLAGGDEGFRKQLDRYTSADQMGKAWRSAVETARSKQSTPALPDGATDEQKAEFRKTLGIPDDPKEYPVNFGDGYEPNEVDGVMLDSFKQALHEQGGDPRTASIALGWYQDLQATLEQDRDERLAEVRRGTQESLREEYGREYEGNINAARELVKTQIGPEGAESMWGMRLEDGSMLQDHPDFVKLMVQMGREYYGSTGIINGDVETTSKTISERIEELRELQQSDPSKYYGEDVQQEMAKLYEQKNKLDARKG